MMTSRVLLILTAMLVVGGCNSPPPEILCTDSSSGRCDCSQTQLVGSSTQPCSTATVGAPALCCALSNYMHHSSGGCSCTTFSCVSAPVATGTNCTCGQGTPSGTQVATCTPGTGEVCCVSGTGSRCTCSPGTTCFAGDTQVTDCTLDRVVQTCSVQFSNAYTETRTDCR